MIVDKMKMRKWGQRRIPALCSFENDGHLEQRISKRFAHASVCRHLQRHLKCLRANIKVISASAAVACNRGCAGISCERRHHAQGLQLVKRAKR
jgi:hypothetical protein